MNEEEYLSKRVASQIEWYDHKSRSNKHWFMVLTLIQSLLALLLPFLSGFLTTTDMVLKITIGAIGLIIASMANILAIFKFQEKWISFRTTSEALVHEKYLYDTKTAHYCGEDPFKAFVERMENLLSTENSQWASYIKYKNVNENKQL